jgi:hypothetical protein
MTFEEYVQKHLGEAGFRFEEIELVGLGWEAHRDHSSCSEIPNSSDPASCPEIPDSCGHAIADGAEVWEKAMMAAIGEDGPRSVADAISKLKAERVPDAEYIRALQDAFDIIQADANTEQNYGSLCRMGWVLARLKSVQEQNDE